MGLSESVFSERARAFAPAQVADLCEIRDTVVELIISRMLDIAESRMEPVHINLREEMALEVGRLLLMVTQKVSTTDVAADLVHPLTVAHNEYKYAASVTTQFEEVPDVQCNIGELNQVVGPLRLQQRAHRVAARSLCEETALADDAMLAGMFHNIGYWILLQECAPELRRACDVARAEGITLHEAENRIIGTSHAEVGAYLLGLWGLPHAVIEAIAFQHYPQRSSQRNCDALAALVAALCLTNEDVPLVTGVAQRSDVRFGEGYLKSLNTPFGWTEARQRIAATAGESQ